ncbi:cytochrome c oxidase subunit 3 [Azohydromonas australica]|uniref:cytochrome c oxidase subunit 3 n=1 Tax=Azohydromonas australica TaxID=364039 RepID=UPI00042114E2|nr:cytochrome c oxidase subunit 3 [Azohydromonas australica]
MSSALPAEAAAPPPDTAQLGMWIFLATELLFFGGLFAAYTWGRTHWSEGFSVASRHTHVVLGTLNTALLLSSSALVAVAAACAGEQRRRRATGWLLAGAALLGGAFLALKGVEYAKEWHEGLFPGPGFALARHAGAELFFMLYFVMTGLHALHLLIGVGLLGTFAWGAWRGSPWADAGRVEVAGLYWHFVDIVWIVLYPLLYLAGRAT